METGNSNTKIQALEDCIKLWTEIKRLKTRSKLNAMENIFKNKEFLHNCPICQWTLENTTNDEWKEDKYQDCNICPITWTKRSYVFDYDVRGQDICFCECSDSPYNKWKYYRRNTFYEGKIIKLAKEALERELNQKDG